MLKGTKHSVESKRKMGIVNIGNKHRLGLKCSNESKYKNREAHLGKKASDETKKR